MKRVMILAVLLILGVACAKSEITGNSEKVSSAKEGVTVFSGTLNPTTKISMGDKVSGSYKALWEEGDVLDVYQSDDTYLGTATLTEGEGSTKGRFELPVAIEDGTEVYLVFGSEGVATEQVQASAGESSFQDYAYAISPVVEVNDGVAEGVTLSHETAVVKVSVSAASSLQGATVSQLIFRSIGGVLSGADKDYVQVDLTTPLTLSGSLQDIWAVAAPYDATGKEIYVALVITKDAETYTLPIGFRGKEIAANQVSYFPLANISDADCAAWYEPHDARMMPGPGYGYGEANCYLIQYKDATYNINIDNSVTPADPGESQTPDPDSAIPSSVTIDYRARGDFRKVDKPSDVTFDWVRKPGSSTVYNILTSNGYTPCNVNSYSKIQSAANYTVIVTNTGALAGAPILAMKKGDNVLWAWTLWNISADGTRLGYSEITTAKKTYKLANMDVGQNTTNFAAWTSNKRIGGYPEVIYRSIFYYQWGRPIPNFWTSWTSNNFYSADNFTVPVIQGPFSIEEAIAIPALMIMNKERGSVLARWTTESDGNLWGGDMKDVTSISVKSIYDPCPIGWRVADPAVYEALAGTISANTDMPGAYYTYSSLASTNYLTIPGRFDGYIMGSADRIQNMGAVGSSSGTITSHGCRWTSFASGSSSSQARAYWNDGAVADNNRTATFNKTCAMPVRCVVDD